MSDELSTSAMLRETQGALAASQADLTVTRGHVVDLLYIIDAFQVESGADREAAYATGIEAVRKLRAERDEALASLAVRTGQLNASREQADLARAELASARQELAQLRSTAPQQRPTDTATDDGETRGI